MSEKVAPLAPAEYQDTVRAALAEDIGAGDVTTNATVDSAQRAQAVLVRANGSVRDLRLPLVDGEEIQILTTRDRQDPGALWVLRHSAAYLLA